MIAFKIIIKKEKVKPKAKKKERKYSTKNKRKQLGPPKIR